MLSNSWIRSKWYDTVFILFPPFLCLLLIFMFPALFDNEKEENVWIWLVLVVCIDVGHVYSTIYRTYMDKAALQKNRMLFYGSPVLIYIAGVMLHSIDPLFFWRAMTYLAVFHFIRQQYGFMRLYSRKEEAPYFSRTIDTITIYAATLYPLLYWHLQGKQLFNWFTDDDFLYINSPGIIPFFRIMYISILLVYVSKEMYLTYKSRTFNLPKNLLIAGTVISWYMGIIYFKGDLTFTLLNVVSHGIPYYALVWAHGNKREKVAEEKPRWMEIVFKPSNILLFLGFLFLLAYVEELLWDGLIWKEHGAAFPVFHLPNISENKSMLNLLVPMLALPQLLHYFIDGFIWKVKKDKFGWSKLL